MVLANYWRARQIDEDIVWGMGNKDYGIIGISGSGIGNVYYGRNNNSSQYSLPFENAKLRTSGISIRIGKGTGEISKTDYCLFDDCTTSISNLSVVNNTQSQDDGFSQILMITGTNNSGSELTITEVGICKVFYGNESYASEPAMLAKMLLENPITLPAGGGFRIVLEWKEQ